MTPDARPFVSFNFRIEIAGSNGEPLCNAEFSECDGLETTLEVKTIREGGRNNAQVRLAGPQSIGALTLKRGVTQRFDLWDWFSDTVRDPGLRADAQIVLLAADHETVQATFKLSRCIPIKMKAPALNAKDGAIAIEELQIAYETLELEKTRT